MRKSIVASVVLVVVAGLFSTASAQPGRPAATVTPTHARLSQVSPAVQAVVRELDGSARVPVLLASLSAARTGGNLPRWALELQSVVHDRNGNYLFKLYLVLRQSDANGAREVAELLAQQGVAVGPSTGHFEHLEHLDPSAPLPSQPAHVRAGKASMGHWVDAFVRAEYDQAYKPDRRGSLSELLQLTYADGSTLDIDIRLISDNCDPAPFHAMAYAYVGAGKRLFPLRLGRSTIPKLWRAKHEVALAAMYRSNQDYETTVGIAVAGVMSNLPLGLVAPVQEPPSIRLGAQRARTAAAPRTLPAPASYGQRAARGAGERLTTQGAREIGILRDAARGNGNFGLGSATHNRAMALGEAWVGPGARVARDGRTMISADGLRQFRPPSWKPRLGRTQANFEQRTVPEGPWTSNGHLDIELGATSP